MSTGTWSASLQSESPACSVCLERSPPSVYQAPGQSRCVQQSKKAQKHKIQRKLRVKLKLLLRIISWHFYALLPTQCLWIAFFAPSCFLSSELPRHDLAPLHLQRHQLLSNGLAPLPRPQQAASLLTWPAWYFLRRPRRQTGRLGLKALPVPGARWEPFSLPKPTIFSSKCFEIFCYLLGPQLDSISIYCITNLII